MEKKATLRLATNKQDFAPNVFSALCPSREILNHICSRWGVLILIALQEGTHRFSELRRRITGVSEKMLAQTLQTLTNDGLIERKSYPVVPPFVEYSLTPLGIEAAKHVVALTGWIELNLTKILAQQSDSAESIKE
jgi:DNA-binding HxlR family transcriptional regulator